MAKSSSKLELLGHFIVAAVLLFKGMDKVMIGHVLIRAVMIASGILVLLFLLYSIRTGRGHRMVKAVAFLFEALAMSLVTYLYFEEGKQYVQYATLAAAVLCLCASFMSVVRVRKDVHS